MANQRLEQLREKIRNRYFPTGLAGSISKSIGFVYSFARIEDLHNGQRVIRNLKDVSKTSEQENRLNLNNYQRVGEEIRIRPDLEKFLIDIALNEYSTQKRILERSITKEELESFLIGSIKKSYRANEKQEKLLLDLLKEREPTSYLERSCVSLTSEQWGNYKRLNLNPNPSIADSVYSFYVNKKDKYLKRGKNKK